MSRITGRMNDGTAYICSETGNEGVGAFTTQRRTSEIIAKLAAYEDLEESERFIKLPCGIGDRVWFLCDTNKLCGIFTRTEVKSASVCAIVVALTKLIPNQVQLVIRYERKNGKIFYMKSALLGETVFLTKDEAEKALMEREHNKKRDR